MPTSQSQKKEAIAQATEQELASLAGRGVRIAGNACSPIVLVKGDLDDAERAGGEPAVRELLSLWRLGALFLAHQYLDAENRLFFGRCGGPGVAHPYPPPGGGGKIAEKN